MSADPTFLFDRNAPPPLTVSTALPAVPALFADAGDQAGWRYIEFLTAEIRNPNTRDAYTRALHRFSAWCGDPSRRWRLEELTPVHVAAYVEALGRALAKPSVKLHLSALRMLGDYLVLGHVLRANPAAAVRGPKYVVKTGKTPVLSRAEAKTLLSSIPTDTLAGLRDRAFIALMVFTFARVSAAVALNVADYRAQGKHWRIELHEKGGRDHTVPAHHALNEYLDAYLKAAGIEGYGSSPLFPRLDRWGRLTATRLSRREALALVKRRCRTAGLGDRICNHSFRATGITNFLENGGTIERAQALAAHESPRTTKLYDRRNDLLSLDDIERIQF